MQCPECHGTMRQDSACPACGYEVGQATHPKGDGWPRCTWTTKEKTCRLWATGDHLCAWHRHLRLVFGYGPTAGFSEREEFEQWVVMFRPGGLYGHNPGQWWGELEGLWAAIHGDQDPQTWTPTLRYQVCVTEHEDALAASK